MCLDIKRDFGITITLIYLNDNSSIKIEKFNTYHYFIFSNDTNGKIAI